MNLTDFDMITITAAALILERNQINLKKCPYQGCGVERFLNRHRHRIEIRAIFFLKFSAAETRVCVCFFRSV